MCTGSDPIVNGAPFAVPQQFVHVNNTIVHPIPNYYLNLNSFEWTDASAGLVDVNMDFNVDHVSHKLFYPNGTIPDWCNTKGGKYFRLTIHGMCMHKSDDEFVYI